MKEEHMSLSNQHPSAQAKRTMSMTRPIYPFTALVGQEEMKLALLLNAVSPQIAGVLIRGDKGTAKSTAVRALQTLLPVITVSEGCPFSCDPAQLDSLCDTCRERLERQGTLPTLQRPIRLIELPLGATEDRVLGTLNLERAIKEGERHFEPGLLAAAHRGILYIDEVNLLPDHLVDALLDAAASGLNVVEREGISFAHPASFLLIGTMNPEEGDLRPQLLDRFGLSVEVQSLKDPALRTEVVKRRIAFETDPHAFMNHWQASDETVRHQIAEARKLLPQVTVPESLLGLIAHICVGFDVEGLRADLTTYKAASALAALEQRCVVTEQDIQRVAGLALAHRMRRQPFEQPGINQQQLEQLIHDYQSTMHDPGEQQKPANSLDGSEPAQLPSPSSYDERGETHPIQQELSQDAPSQNDTSHRSEQVIPPGAPTALATRTLELAGTRQHILAKAMRSPGQHAARTGAITQGERGRVIGARQPTRQPTTLALAATLRATALRQKGRRAASTLNEEKRLWLERWDILEPVRQQKRGALVLFVVDASGSMAARKRMAAAKSAVLALLQQAYQARDHIGLVQFRGKQATLVLPPTGSTSLAARRLADLPTGGRTPLASALRLALRTIQTAQRHTPAQRPLLVLVTDGRANVADHNDPHQSSRTAIEDAFAAAQTIRAAGIASLVIDTEEGPARTALARTLAQELGAIYITLPALETGKINHAVCSALGRQS